MQIVTFFPAFEEINSFLVACLIGQQKVKENHVRRRVKWRMNKQNYPNNRAHKHLLEANSYLTRKDEKHFFVLEILLETY